MNKEQNFSCWCDCEIPVAQWHGYNTNDFALTQEINDLVFQSYFGNYYAFKGQNKRNYTVASYVNKLIF